MGIGSYSTGGGGRDTRQHVINGWGCWNKIGYGTKEPEAKTET